METDGTPLHVLVVESAVGEVCFFPDGSHLLTSEVLGAKVWDARTYKKVSTLDMDEESPGAIDLSANGRLIAVEGWTTHHVRVYSARDGRLRCFLRGQRQEIKALAISPDSKLAVGGSRTPDKRLRVWEVSGLERPRLWGVPERKPIRTIDLPEDASTADRIAFSPDGGRMAVAARAVLLFDTGTWRVERRLTKEGRAIYHLAFSRDGRYLATATAETKAAQERAGQISPLRIVEVYDTASWKVVRTLGAYRDQIRGLAFAPTNSDVLAAASEDGTAHLWQVSTGKPLRRYAVPGGYFEFAAFSPDGKLLALSVWDRQKKNQKAEHAVWFYQVTA